MEALINTCGYDTVFEEELLSGSEHIKILTYEIDGEIKNKTVYEDEYELEYITRCAQAFQTRDKTKDRRQKENDEEDTSWTWRNKDEYKIKWKGAHHEDGTPITIYPDINPNNHNNK